MYPGYAIVAMLLYYVRARASHVLVSRAMEEDDFRDDLAPRKRSDETSTRQARAGYAIVAMLLYYVKACAGHVLVSSAMEEDDFRDDFHSPKKKKR